MASKVLQTKIEGQLNCSVCMEIFTHPKLLMCSHVFCQECLGRLVRWNQWGQPSINCPTCRQHTPLTGNSVNSLPSAIHISQLLEVLEEHKADELAKARKVYYCKKHDDKEVDLYCETCRELVCWKCIKKSGVHHSHDCEELGDAVEKFKTDLSEAIVPLEKKVKDVAHAFEVCQEKITEQQLTVEVEIRTNIRKLHDCLDARQEELLGQLDCIIKEKQELLEGQKQQLETIQLEIVRLKDTAAEGRSHEDILVNKTGKIDRAHEIAADFLTDSLMPNIVAEMQFSSSDGIFKLCQTFGELQQGKQEVASCIAKLSIEPLAFPGEQAVPCDSLLGDDEVYQERREKGQRANEWPPRRKGRSNKSNWRRKN